MIRHLSNLWYLSALAIVAAASATAPAVTGAPCAGDCDGDGVVTVDEVIRCVNIALGTSPLTQCAAADIDGSENVTVDEVVSAVERALRGCFAAPTPSPTASSTSVPTSLPTATATSTPTGAPTGESVPTSRDELIQWLEVGSYLDWPAESAAHASVGPHFGRVRTYVNPALFDSLAVANPMHPRGAAVVKELYGNGTDVRGWSVMVKTAADSDAGRNWYFLEVFDDRFFASSFGAGICVGCHQGPYRGLESKDFILIPFPLQ